MPQAASTEQDEETTQATDADEVADTTTTETPEGETPAAVEAAEEAGEVVVTIGDESPPSEEEGSEAAPEWVKELRKTSKENARRVRELEAENVRLKTPATVASDEPGEKPTLAGCEYDEAQFEAKLDEWKAKVKAADDKKAAKTKAEEDDRTAWQGKLNNYSTAKAALKVADAAEAEEAVQASLSVTQQGIILQGAADPALVVYALGKNPKKRDELAAIKDPVQFAFAVAKLETTLKVVPKKALPTPEKKVTGDKSVSNATAQLEKLREEAAKSGDFTKVREFKAAQKRAAG